MEVTIYLHIQKEKNQKVLIAIILKMMSIDFNVCPLSVFLFLQGDDKPFPDELKRMSA